MYFLKSSVTFKVHRAHVATFLQLGVVLLSWNTEKQCWSLMSSEVYKKKNYCLQSALKTWLKS